MNNRIFGKKIIFTLFAFVLFVFFPLKGGGWNAAKLFGGTNKSDFFQICFQRIKLSLYEDINAVMMTAPAYIGVGTSTQGTNVTSISIDQPSGTSIDDFLIAIISTDGNTTITAPAGWSTLNQGQSTTNASTLSIFYRTASNAGSSSHNFTWSGGQHALGAILAYTGVDASNPFDNFTISSDISTGTSNNPTSPTKTTSEANTAIIYAYSADADYGNNTPYEPSGTTGVFGNRSANSGSNGVSIGIARKDQPSAGTTGTGVFDMRNANSEEWRAVTLVLRGGGCPVPSVIANAGQITCTNQIPDDNGKIQIDAILGGDRYGFSLGSAYSGPAYASATDMTGATYPIVLLDNLTNPATATDYTIRVFNSADTCFTDVTVTLLPQDCTVGCSCTEKIYLNDEDVNEVHKFTLDNSTGALTEIGSPWLGNNTIIRPHGLAVDNNGRIYVGQGNTFDSEVVGPIFQMNCDGVVLDNDYVNTPDGKFGYNVGSANGVFYTPDNATNTIKAYSLCTGDLIGEMNIRPGGAFAGGWGFYVNQEENRWYYPDRNALTIYTGLLDTTLYTNTPTVDGTAAFSFTLPTTGIIPMGITKDIAGNYYIVFNTFAGSAATTYIRKYDASGNLLTTISDNTSGNNTSNGQSGFWGARGIAYSEGQNSLYVGSFNNCVAVFDTSLTEQVALNIGNPFNTKAKGVSITKECCPASNNIVIDTVMCSARVNEVFFLQDLINCEGTICEGVWQAGSGNTGMTYFSCDNTVRIDALNACGSFTLQSDGTNGNAQCGAFSISININVSNIDLTVTQNSCTDNNDGTFTTNYTARVDWSSVPCEVGEMINVTHNGANIGTINPATDSSPSTFNFAINANGSGNNFIKAAFTSASCADSMQFLTPVPCPNDVAACTGTSGIGGNVFEDYNYDGVDSGTLEPGLQGIKVYAFDCAGNKIDSAFTDSDGDYLFNTTGNGGQLTNGEQYRIEFDLPENVANWAEPTTSGANNGTIVQFVTEPACAGLGLASPGDYCQENPNYFTTCFVPLDPINGMFKDEPMGAAAPFDTDENTKNSLTLKPKSSETGATYGVAWQRPSQSLFVSSYMKQTTGFGPNGSGGTTTGGIYRIVDDGAGNPTVSLFIDLQSIGTGADPHPESTDICTSMEFGTNNNACWYHDMEAFGKVGKLSLGDLEVAPDEQSLFTVNLNERTLVKIPLGNNLANPVAGTPEEYDLSSLFNTCSSTSDWRPFGLGKNRGMMYLGAVCSAESTQSTDDLKGLIYEFNPDNPTTFNLIFSFDLDYEREGVIRNCNVECKGYWQPWTEKESEIKFNLRTSGSGQPKADGIEPMPMLTDIEFFGDDLILGLRDRSGDLFGDDSGSPFDFQSPRTFSHVSSGDVLRAARNTNGSYTLENNGVTGIYTSAENYTGGTAPGNINSGPGGKEFYSEGFGVHAELPLGGLAQMRGNNELIISSMNPHPPTVSSGGVSAFNNLNGTRVRGNVYFDNSDDFDFGKNDGLGDIELMCASAPLEIGHYVWLDEDEDGIQDACEPPLANVVVELYNAAGDLVAIDTTNNQGVYNFNDTNIRAFDAQADTTLLPNTEYTIVVAGSTTTPFANDVLTIGSQNYELTLRDAEESGRQSSDNIDSDALIGGNPVAATNGQPFISTTTGNAGSVDHSLGIGFKSAPCRVAIESTFTENCTGVNSFTTDLNVIVSWSAPPAGENIVVTYDGGNTQTIPVATTGTSPDTVTISIPADGTKDHTIIATFATTTACADTLNFINPVPCPADEATCSTITGCLGGVIYEDYNCNGTRDTLEVGLQGMEIQIYDCNNNLVTTSYSDADGDWQACALNDAEQYRVEFVMPDEIACWAVPTHASSGGNQTDVQFLSPPFCTEYSVSSPEDYCQENPDLIFPCFVGGTFDGVLADSPTIVKINYIGFEGPIGSSGYVPPPHVGTQNQTGTVWGSAHAKIENKTYFAAHLRRHAGFGSLGTGGIYQYDPLTDAIIPWLDLQTLGVNTGTDTRNQADTLNRIPDTVVRPSYDRDAFYQVGKMSIGDITITTDGQFLFLVNMKDKELVQIDIATKSLVRKVPITAQTLGVNTPLEDIIPWGLAFRHNRVYVGVTNNAQNSQAVEDLNGYILSIDAYDNNATFAKEFNFNFGYDRETQLFQPVEWRPWNDNASSAQRANPQPVISDIVFDTDGSMVLGITDVFGSKVQSGNYGPESRDSKDWISAGDILRVCKVDGNFKLETEAGCVNPLRPNEWYDDTRQSPGSDRVKEIALGALKLSPRNGQVVGTAVDEFSIWENGIVWWDNRTGNFDKGYMVFYTLGPGSNPDGNDAFISSGKTNGLGGLEFICEPAPLEIGNYVWCDSLQNGIQDACERGIDGLLVQLYDRNGNLVGLDSTANGGQYYFNQNNVDTTGIAVDGSGVATPNSGSFTGMNYTTQYYIVFGDGQFSGSQFSLSSTNYGITPMANVGSNDKIDSDVDGSSLTSGSLGARPDGLPFIAMTTSATGCGDHKYDLGLTCNGCEDINQLVADRTICSGGFIDTLGAITSFTNPDSIAFVYFTTAQTDSSVIYTGGTGIDTVQISASSDTVLLTNVLINGFIAATNPDTFFVYAIKQPTPTETTCRPYEEIRVIVHPIDTTEINQAICDGAGYFFNGEVRKDAGMYFDTLMQTNGCDSIVKLTLTLNPKPDLATTDTTICNGATTDLNNRVTDNANLAGTTTFHSTLANANTGANPLANPVNPTITTRFYVRKVTDAHGCPDVDSTLITVQSIPDLATTNQTVCAGESVNLSTLVTDNATGTDGTITYHSSLTDAQTGANNLGSNLTPSATTKYYIRKVTTTGSCVDIDSLTITLQPLPNLVTTDLTICTGTSTDLNDRVTDNNNTTGSQTFFLSMADLNAGSNIQSNPVSPTSTTKYYVRKVTNTANCQDVDSLTISVQPLPNLVTRDTTLCAGQSVDLANQTTDTEGTTGTMTYHNTLADAQNGTNMLGSTTVTPSSDEKYYVRKITTTASCLDIDSIAVTIQPNPDLSTTDSTICNGDMVDIS
ncbi:MAG: SdrD B-like domain-containing protein, partial [Bacteroidota bacterium]